MVFDPMTENRKIQRRQRVGPRRRMFIFCLMLPVFVLLPLFTLYPLLDCFHMSVSEWDGAGEPKHVWEHDVACAFFWERPLPQRQIAAVHEWAKAFTADYDASSGPFEGMRAAVICRRLSVD